MSYDTTIIRASQFFGYSHSIVHFALISHPEVLLSTLSTINFLPPTYHKTFIALHICHILPCVSSILCPADHIYTYYSFVSELTHFKYYSVRTGLKLIVAPTPCISLDIPVWPNSNSRAALATYTFLIPTTDFWIRS